MIELLWPIVVAVVGVVAGWYLKKYRLERYQGVLDTFLQAINDGRITKEEAKAIIEAIERALDDDS